MFNIITPTFNRHDLIHRVYESLKNQSYKGLKWIVVDDASTDNTKELISKWKNETKDFSIEYYLLPQNLGKPKAVNFGLTKCTYPITIIADSDDTFVTNTLKDLKFIWDEINETTNNIVSVWTLVVDEDDHIKGDKFPQNKWKVNFEKRVLNINKELVGDKWASWRTDILQAHPLYSDSHAHVEESQTWNRINKKYDFLCMNVAFLKAHVSPNSLITSKKTRKEVARSGYYSAYYALKEVSYNEIIKYKFYRWQAFDYIKSWFYYSDKNLKINASKFVICFCIFIIYAPKRVFKKIA